MKMGTKVYVQMYKCCRMYERRIVRSLVVIQLGKTATLRQVAQVDQSKTSEIGTVGLVTEPEVLVIGTPVSVSGNGPK